MITFALLLGTAIVAKVHPDLKGEIGIHLLFAIVADGIVLHTFATGKWL